MKEVYIYNIVIESKFLNLQYCKNFAANNIDNCIEKVKTYVEKVIKPQQFASDYQIIELKATGTIIIEK